MQGSVKQWRILTQTVLYETYAPTCVYNTDLGGHISGQSGEYTLDLLTFGKYVCTKRIPDGSRCDQASIIFAPYIPNYSTNTTIKETQWRNTLCHEVAHGVGLWHDNPGCFADIINANTLATGYLYYSNSQVQAVNGSH